MELNNDNSLSTLNSKPIQISKIDRMNIRFESPGGKQVTLQAYLQIYAVFLDTELLVSGV